MKRIYSFDIDHTKHEVGLWVSHVDRVGLLAHVTTFDLRLKRPYRDVPLRPATVHTIEHCLATYLRDTREDILYVGPMGCLTGFYILVKGCNNGINLLPSLQSAFQWMAELTDVPGATKKECGNYTFMDIEDTRKEAKQILKEIKEIIDYVRKSKSEPS